MTSQRHSTIKHVQTLLFLRLPFGCPSRTCCISYLWLPNGVTANLAASDTFTNSVSGFVGLGTAWLGPLARLPSAGRQGSSEDQPGKGLLPSSGGSGSVRVLADRFSFLLAVGRGRFSHLNTVTLGLGQLTQHGS